MFKQTLMVAAAWGFLGMGGTSPGAPEEAAPVVGLYDPSGYGHAVTAILDHLSIPWQKLTEQDLQDPEKLRRFKVVAVIFGYIFSNNADRNLPGEVQQALTEYVQGGGHLYAEFAAYPSNPAAGCSGWSEGPQGDLKVLTNGHPITKSFPEGEVIPYSLYGANPSKDVGMPLLGTTTGALSMVVNEYGRGVCVYSGAILGAMDSNQPAVKQLIANVFAFLSGTPAPSFTVDAAAVEQQLTGPAFDPADQVVDLARTAVAIFSEPGFPYSGMPPTVTPERVAEGCQEAGLRWERLSAAQLSDPKVLHTARFHTLVLTYGETFPVDCLRTVREFLAAGGRLVGPAGAAFSHPTVRDAHGWRDDGQNAGLCQALFGSMLPFAYPYGASRPVTAAVLLAPEMLPDLPVHWPLAGGTIGFIPRAEDPHKVPFSILNNRALVVGLSADGEAVSTPVWFLHHDPRVLLLGFRGPSHPWNPEAWPQWKQAMASCLRLVARTPVLMIRDVRPYHSAYRDGETVQVDVLVRCTAGPARNAAVRLDLRERDTGQSVRTAAWQVDLAPGEQKTLTFTWPNARLPRWAYEAVVTARAPGGPTICDRETFTVWNPEIARRAPEVTLRDGIPRLNGKAARLDGVALFIDDMRNIGLGWGGGVFADGVTRPRTVLSVRDMHLGWLAATGATSVREMYWSLVVGPHDLEQSPEPPGLRAADSILHLITGNGFTGQAGPDEVYPPYPAWAEWEQQFGPDQGRAKLEERNRWCGRFAARYREFRNLFWTLANEPDGPDAATETERRQQSAHNAWYYADKARRLKEGFGGGICGLQTANAATNSAWDRRALRRSVDYSACHPYAPPLLYQRDRLNFAFAWNFGRPVHAGEVGMHPPADLEQIQHLILAEGGLGYGHFYLWGPPGVNYETCMGSPDQTEREFMKPYRRYMALQQIIRPDRFRPNNAVLVYSHEQRLADPASFDRFAGLYLDLLRQGIHPLIIEENELAELGRAVEYVLWPGETRLSERIEARLQGLVSAGKIQCLAVSSSMEPLHHLTTSPPHHLTTSSLPAWVSRANAADLLVKPLPVGVETDPPDYVYLLPERSGGHSVILVNHKHDRQVTLRAGPHRVQVNVPPRHAVLLSFDPQHRLVVAEGYGNLRVDGQPLVTAPEALAWVVGSDDGLPIAQSQHLLLHAEPQNAVKVANRTANYLAHLKDVTVVYPAGRTFQDAAGIIQAGLARNGVKAFLLPADQATPDRLGRSHVLLVGDASVNPLAGRFGGRLTVQGRAPTRFVDLGPAQLKQPWSGCIKAVVSPWNPQRKAILVQGVTPSATVIAAHNFASLQLLDNYTVGPWMRYRRPGDG